MTNEERLQRRLEKARQQVATLERLIEDKSRELYLERENALQARDYIDAVVESMRSFLLVVDEDKIVKKANKSLLTELGYSLEEVVEQPLAKIVPESESLFNNNTETAEPIIKCKNEDSIPVLVSIATMEHDGTKDYVVVAQDLREQKELEAQLRHAQKMESIGQLAAGIAHEINTPIQYVRDNTVFLQEEFQQISNLIGKLREIVDSSATTEQKEEVSKLIENVDLDYLLEEIPSAVSQTLDGANRVAKIVKSMKTFSHPGGEEKVSIDINEAIESTLTVSTNEWKYLADVELELDESKPSVPCFPGELNQVLLNIIVNAAHAIGESNNNGQDGKGLIQISSKQIDKNIEIRIKDSGKGIPQSVQDKIFDPFFTTKGVGKGTGQGLAFAYSTIVERHQGNLNFETEEGKGTTFVITLPLN